ncbi:glycerate kinase [Thermasporomyces composti]|jgi:glycerate kinase|uniref:Glycerate kinase n=1 Tax=Thermasporomyces composti TaxID=696763 RepID=A0A3D9V7A0_THECX|nr:glycerate kinase [Thermasporomyces composti]REF34915.1 glycerate kinase [Thermasporomyces composti]
MAGVRVLIAPDKFAGTLSAVEAAEAIAEGWRRQAPGDEVLTAPMSDGGPGFIDVLHAALGGELQAVTVTGPLGEPTPATLLLHERTAYVESAQACGLALVPADRRDPEAATTYGVGELLRAALDAGVRRVVVGLGGSGTNDGGAGLLAAMGAVADPPTALTGGPRALADLTRLDVRAARERLAGVELLVASDVDNPLLGLRGATNVFGPQKGLRRERLVVVDAALARLADLADRRLADAKGAGAAGGLGYALLLLGGRRVPGIDTVAQAVGLPEKARNVDLVLTGEGSFDFQSASGKVVSGVATVAARALRPCVVLAGQVHVGAREMRAMGVESAYSVVDLVGEKEALGRPRESLAALAERVARTWSR